MWQREPANTIQTESTDINMKHVYNDHINTDMSYEEFYAFCRDSWQQKYEFLW